MLMFIKNVLPLYEHSKCSYNFFADKLNQSKNTNKCNVLV